MKRLFKIVTFTFFLFAIYFNFAFAQPICSCSERNIYEINQDIYVKCNGYSGFNLEFIIGTPSNSPYQQDISLEGWGPNAKIITENNVQKLVSKNNVTNNGKFKYTIKRIVQVSNLDYLVDLSKTKGQFSNDIKEKYAKAQKKIESDSDVFKKVSNEFFRNMKNPYEIAEKSYAIVNSYMKYRNNYGIDENKGALSALIDGEGNGEDLAEVYVAFLRANGIPARTVSGYWTEQDKDKDVSRVAEHCWAEYYLPEFGWIPVETTNECYVNGKKKTCWDYFSKLPNNDHVITGYDTNIFGNANVTVNCWGNKPEVTKFVKIKKLQ